MLPHLQGTIKLKAVSRLFGRMPFLQGCPALAESPVCRQVSATLLTLQSLWFTVLSHQSESHLVMSDSLQPHELYGDLQARILEWVAFRFSRDFPNPGVKPRSPAL